MGRAAAVLGIVWAISNGRGAWGAPAGAPAPDELAEPFVLEPVVVTGTRSERKLSEAPVATEVIGRKEIEASGTRTVSELLDKQPGLEVFRSFAGASVRVQGLDPEYVLVLVDGQRAIGRVGGAIDLARFSTAAIERVEIVKGASSALYGSDALGGVINIITRRSQNRFEAEAQASYGSFGSAQVGGQTGGALGPLRGRFSGGWRRSAGFDLDPSTVGREGSGFDVWDVAERLDWQAHPRLSIAANIDWSLRKQTGIDSSPTGAVLDRRSQGESVGIAIAPELRLAERDRLRTTLHLSRYVDQFLVDQRGSDVLDAVEKTTDELAELNVEGDFALPGRQRLTAGAEGALERLRSPRLDGGQGERRRTSVFAQDEWTLFSERRLVCVPGVRLDADSQYGLHTSPKLAVRFDPTSAVVLRASYGWGFRAPSFKELLLRFQNPGAGYVVEGNPELRPETSRSLNAGAELRFVSWLWISLGVFRNDLSDMITTRKAADGDAAGPTRYTYANVTAARTQGVESVVSVRPARGLVLDLGYTYLDARDREGDRPLDGRARHRGTVTLRGRAVPQAIGGIEGSARASIVGRRPFTTDGDGDGTTALTYAQPYAAVDLRAAKDLGTHTQVFAQITNLLDAGDRELQPLEPRTVWGGIRVSY